MEVYEVFMDTMYLKEIWALSIEKDRSLCKQDESNTRDVCAVKSVMWQVESGLTAILHSSLSRLQQ